MHVRFSERRSERILSKLSQIDDPRAERLLELLPGGDVPVTGLLYLASVFEPLALDSDGRRRTRVDFDVYRMIVRELSRLERHPAYHHRALRGHSMLVLPGWQGHELSWRPLPPHPSAGTQLPVVLWPEHSHHRRDPITKWVASAPTGMPGEPDFNEIEFFK